MWKAIFKKDLPCIGINGSENFTFKKDKKYTIELETDDYIMVRQPNSPKDKNWVTQFKKSQQPDLFDMIDEF